MYYFHINSGTSTLTRADHAHLSNAGYSSISDRHGNPPLVIDPAEYIPLNIDHEITDSLQANEIVIQFLALSRYVSVVDLLTVPFIDHE